MKTLIDIDHLVVDYADRRAVDDVSLSVKPGQVMALIGPNGAGKTSLIRAASGVIPCSSGVVRLNGIELTRLKPAERARLLAIVPQARQIPGAFTARELVSTGRTPWLNWLGQISARDEGIIRTAMQRTETASLANRRVGELSGGEQQRLLLARALAQNAPMLMLDEPFAHLDLRYQIELLDLIHTLVKELNLGLLVALHDLNLVARIADRVILLAKGEMQALGTKDEILKPDLLSQAFGVPLSQVKAGKSRTYIFPD